MRKQLGIIFFIICIFLAFNAAFAGIKIPFSYGNNIAYNNQNVALQADLYKPNLFATKLPLVILYHGGGYASGSKDMAMLKPFTEKLNAKNISVILPDFRQGWYEADTKGICESATNDKFLDAAHRAYQDNRALIRYCKANAATLGIDSNQIFLMGISSGGFLVMHSLYINDSSVNPERLARLGSLDNQSNTFKNSTDVAGIISIVGGFYEPNPTIIKPYPLLLFNNTCDVAVDFFNGWIGNCSNAVRSYGPGIFTKSLEQYQHPYALHVFCGFNHSFSTLELPYDADEQTVQYIIQKSTQFIANTGTNTTTEGTHIASDSIASKTLYDCNNFETFYWCKDDSIEITSAYFQVIPNPLVCGLQPKLNIRHLTDETLTIEIIDALGKIQSQQKIAFKHSQNIIYLQNNDFSRGINILLVRDENGKIIYRTKVMKYCSF